MTEQKRVFRKLVDVPPNVAEIIENFRFEKRFRTEAEAVRAIINAGIAALNLENKDA